MQTEKAMTAEARPPIMAVHTEDAFDEVGRGRCTTICFGTMSGSMANMPTIQIWEDEFLAAEYSAAHATRIIYDYDNGALEGK